MSRFQQGSLFVSVVFWPPCMVAAEDSSSTRGRLAWEQLGWLRVWRGLRADRGVDATGQLRRSDGSWKRPYPLGYQWRRWLVGMV